MVNSKGSLRFLITWCPATEIIGCILHPCGTIPNVCLEITFSFRLKLLGAFIFSSSDSSKALSYSCVFSFLGLSLTFCSMSLVDNFCWTLFRAFLAAALSSLCFEKKFPRSDLKIPLFFDHEVVCCGFRLWFTRFF